MSEQTTPNNMSTKQTDSIFTARQNLETEICMLQAMYDTQVEWIGKNREIVYHSEDNLSSLTMRIPDDYLISALPEVVTATARKTDLRDRMKAHIVECELQYEVLDLIVDRFRQMIQEIEEQQHDEPSVAQPASDAKATVVVWLHHLLNTSKRKQAMSPPASSISGLTKPGYPGVLVFSGPAQDVHEHVQELKSLNWQAFQIRLESEKQWTFQHGAGIVEVENMADVVADIEPGQRAEFLQVMKIG